MVSILPAILGQSLQFQGQSLDLEDLLEKGMATHSSSIFFFHLFLLAEA